jgi:hypothetical protein
LSGGVRFRLGWFWAFRLRPTVGSSDGTLHGDVPLQRRGMATSRCHGIVADAATVPRGVGLTFEALSA